MKFYLIILLAFALLLQPLSKFIIVSNYALNVKSITAKYCENKAKPKLKCNGKCHLKKQLIQHDKQNNQQKNENKEVSPFQWYSSGSDKINLSFNTQKVDVNWTYLLKESKSFTWELIKPPTV